MKKSLKIRTLLLLLTILGGITFTQAKHLRGGVVRNSSTKQNEFAKPELIRYILLNPHKLTRFAWNTVPGTNQEVYLVADPYHYLENAHLSKYQIDNLIILPAKYVKQSVKYRNYHYDSTGIGTPIQEDYLPLIMYNDQGEMLKYVCTPDSVAIAKGNCINEHDNNGSSLAAIPKKKIISQKDSVYNDCFEIKIPMMDRAGDSVVYSENFTMMYNYNSGVWFDSEGKQICPELAPKDTSDSDAEVKSSKKGFWYKVTHPFAKRKAKKAERKKNKDEEEDEIVETPTEEVE